MTNVHSAMIPKSDLKYLIAQLFCDDTDTEFRVRDFFAFTEFLPGFYYWRACNICKHNFNDIRW